MELIKRMYKKIVNLLFNRSKTLKDKEALDKYIQENITLLETRAVELNSSVGKGSWFTLKDIVARTKHKDINKIMRLLHLLSSAKLLVSTITVDRNNLHVEKYKVVLDNVSRGVTIRSEISRLKSQIEKLKKEL